MCVCGFVWVRMKKGPTNDKNGTSAKNYTIYFFVPFLASLCLFVGIKKALYLRALNGLSIFVCFSFLGTKKGPKKGRFRC